MMGEIVNGTRVALSSLSLNESLGEKKKKELFFGVGAGFVRRK